MQFDVEFQAEHLDAMMAAIRHEVATPQEMLESMGLALVFANEERHRQGLDPDGKPWKELAESTKAAGPRKGGPLNRTGRMLESFRHQANGDTLRLGFNDGDGFPAIFHQDGSKPHVISARKAKALAFGGIVRKRVNHPGLDARPLVGFPDSDQQLVADVAADHLSLVINSIR
jgi:phage gpG-like protein